MRARGPRLIGLAALLVAAAPAHGATISYEQSGALQVTATHLTVTDSGTESNSLTIEQLGDGRVRVIQAGGTLRLDGPANCTLTESQTQRMRVCPKPGGTFTVDVDLGGGTNLLNLFKTLAASEIDVIGGPDSDQVYYVEGPGKLTADLGDGKDAVVGGAQGDVLKGGAGKGDVVIGDAGNDVLDGGPGDADRLDGGKGADVVAGGDGINDQVDYSTRTAALRVTLLDDGGTDGEQGEGDDVRSDVEFIIAGAGSDQLTGNAAANYIEGRDGDDAIAGGDGGDLLFGNIGNDLIDGDGTDAAAGVGGPQAGRGEDTLDGAAGDDRLRGGDGVDTLNAGPGDDEVDGRSSFPSYAAADETADCGPGDADRALLDWNDAQVACESPAFEAKPIDVAPPLEPDPPFKPPGPGPQPPLGPPTVSKGRVSISIHCAGRSRCRVTVTVRTARVPVKRRSRKLTRPQKLGRLRGNVPSGKTNTLAVKLSSAGKRAVKRKASLVIEVTIDGAGRPIRFTRPLPLSKDQLGEGGTDRYAEADDSDGEEQE